jgi:uncharacterized membrane protein
MLDINVKATTAGVYNLAARSFQGRIIMVEQPGSGRGEDERFCAECGGLVKKADAHCAHCGASLAVSAASSERQAVQSASGLEPNMAGALSYLLTWVTGIIFLLIEKDDEYVRYHARQAIVFGAAVFAGWIVLSIFFYIVAFIPFIGGIIAGLLATLVWFVYWIGFLIIWVALIYKAYQGERFKLPILGDFAENWNVGAAR